VPLTIARGRVDLRPDAGAHVILRLTPGAQRLLSGRHRVRVRVLGALERHVPVLPRELLVSA
jgi:hypothetical protein